MDGDISCFWLLALVRNKNNNEVTEVNCQSYIVMSCHRFFYVHHTRPKVCANLLFNNSTLPNHANTV